MCLCQVSFVVSSVDYHQPLIPHMRHALGKHMWHVHHQLVGRNFKAGTSDTTSFVPRSTGLSVNDTNSLCFALACGNTYILSYRVSSICCYGSISTICSVPAPLWHSFRERHST